MGWREGRGEEERENLEQFYVYLMNVHKREKFGFLICLKSPSSIKVVLLEFWLIVGSPDVQ